MQTAITQAQLQAALTARHGAERQEKLSRACIGIAGLGGLGSNIAVQLARLGVGRLVLVDFDRVELSNLNRQHYRLCDIGQPKPTALLQQLQQINPYLRYEIHCLRLTPQNIPAIFADCSIICEAFDDAAAKAMLTTTVLQQLPQSVLVACSGMAGNDSANAITTKKRLQRLYLCGDGTTDINIDGSLLAPRVSVCAAHAETMVMRLLLGCTTP
ncbi:sulfur carrier protein ThiS adenylyltransferase ThiF [Phascolarctobacterium sp.]|uniref:sulfur carrier protein ThiS adenylyltransferase ThiF n=1 Tax=Phascolarctobacterium sp. TaxID=2049039 RepID=UPI003077E567